MGALLALVSAVVYGVTDVVGGLAARRATPVRVAFLAQLGGLAATLCAARAFPTTHVAAADLLWGGLSGLGTGTAMVFLFRGISRGAVSIVVPVSAVGGLALPVLAAVVLLGERPGVLTWVGMITAVPALWLVSGAGSGGAPGDAGSVRDGLASSAGVAVQYFALAQAGAGSGIWPVAAGRVSAVVLVGLAVVASHASTPPATRAGWRVPAAAVLSGVLAAAGLVAYLLATRLTLVAVAVALAALYPVVPVLIGVTALGERPRRIQVAGLVLAGLASALLVVP